MLSTDAEIAAPELIHTWDCPNVDLVEYVGLRGDVLLSCRTCRRTAPLERLLALAALAAETRAEGRYRLDCVRCDAAIWLDRPKARTPLCAACKRRGSR